VTSDIDHLDENAPTRESLTARILAVDDDPTMREIAAAKLRECGHRVSIAADGAEAWSILQSESFDLAVVDLDMPICNGFEFISMIRNSAVHAHMPVVVITSFTDTASIDRAFACGATSFMTKPIIWPLLCQHVQFVLRSAETARELRRARDKADAASSRKDQFLSVVSHELRTPLNAIIGFAELLTGRRDEQGSDPIAEAYINEILGGGRRMLRTLTEAMLYSRIISDDLRIEIGEYGISSLRDRARAELDGFAREAGVALEFSGFDDGEEIGVDMQLLGHALCNLVDNAIKFSPPGGQVSLEACAVRDGTLVIAVRDRGPGMSAEDVATYLAPFTQSDMTLRRSAEGLGLGLTVASTIVRLHGGELLIESQPRGGTIARIVLPEAVRISKSERPASDPIAVSA